MTRKAGLQVEADKSRTTFGCSGNYKHFHTGEIRLVVLTNIQTFHQGQNESCSRKLARHFAKDRLISLGYAQKVTIWKYL